MPPARLPAPAPAPAPAAIFFLLSSSYDAKAAGVIGEGSLPQAFAYAVSAAAKPLRNAARLSQECLPASRLLQVEATSAACARSSSCASEVTHVTSPCRESRGRLDADEGVEGDNGDDDCGCDCRGDGDDGDAGPRAPPRPRRSSVAAESVLVFVIPPAMGVVG
jgi:hypothetical protein